MELSKYFKAQHGRMARVAKEVGVQSGYLSQIAAGSKRAMPAHVPAIERACAYEVRRWDLRPDDWHRIWPDLVGAPGAPAVLSGVAAVTADEPAEEVSHAN